eukprot:1288509-Pleurochrysis_carterae.AAC.1
MLPTLPSGSSPTLLRCVTRTKRNESLSRSVRSELSLRNIPRCSSPRASLPNSRTYRHSVAPMLLTHDNAAALRLLTVAGRRAAQPPTRRI